MNIFMDRMVRAAKLDVNLYEEVEADINIKGSSLRLTLDENQP